MMLYHGTWAGFEARIMRQGLKPQENDRWVYLTTDRLRAEQYAQAWTGGILYRAPEARPEGIILHMELPERFARFIEPDPYSPEEPNQYRLRHDHAHLLRLKKVERMSYAHLSDEERLRASCFLIGVASR